MDMEYAFTVLSTCVEGDGGPDAWRALGFLECYVMLTGRMMAMVGDAERQETIPQEEDVSVRFLGQP